jgi:hypothetical protein
MLQSTPCAASHWERENYRLARYSVGGEPAGAAFALGQAAELKGLTGKPLAMYLGQDRRRPQDQSLRRTAAPDDIPGRWTHAVAEPVELTRRLFLEL